MAHAGGLMVCAIAGCEKLVRTHRGWCTAHYTRWLRYGDPLHRNDGRPSSETGRHRGNDIGYGPTHSRLKAERGPASRHPCASCGERAVQWAYRGDCPLERWTEKQDGAFVASSPNLHRYDPLCRACHGKQRIPLLRMLAERATEAAA